MCYLRGLIAIHWEGRLLCPWQEQHCYGLQVRRTCVLLTTPNMVKWTLLRSLTFTVTLSHSFYSQHSLSHFLPILSKVTQYRIVVIIMIIMADRGRLIELADLISRTTQDRIGPKRPEPRSLHGPRTTFRVSTSHFFFPSFTEFLDALPSSIVLTLDAKLRLQNVSSTLYSTGLTHTIISVLESWERQSCRRYVSVELRNGTCDCVMRNE